MRKEVGEGDQPSLLPGLRGVPGTGGFSNWSSAVQAGTVRHTHRGLILPPLPPRPAGAQDSPINKLLYARDIPRYKRMVERYRAGEGPEGWGGRIGGRYSGGPRGVGVGLFPSGCRPHDLWQVLRRHQTDHPGQRPRDELHPGRAVPGTARPPLLGLSTSLPPQGSCPSRCSFAGTSPGPLRKVSIATLKDPGAARIASESSRGHVLAAAAGPDSARCPDARSPCGVCG